tara:strand:+ start:1016 stop:1912 length:897 start_codon:yes stop_codon:yes gene_type:complete
MIPNKTLDINNLQSLLQSNDYISDNSIITSIFLSINLNKPLLIEGEPGVGKTEIAKVLSNMLNTKLIRLQCYEGLDVNSTVYEWNYLKQLMKIRIEENKSEIKDIETELFSEKYLYKRPLIEALLYNGKLPPVLLIDEIDRSDEEFEGFLLEFLAEFQVTIPEIGTIKAKKPPIVIISSNRTRELGDGLRRRCLYLYIDYPTIEKELQILKIKVPNINSSLANEVCSFIKELRSSEKLTKKPGISETIDWALALMTLKKFSLDKKIILDTISCIIKSQDDVEKIDAVFIQKLLDKISR